MRVAMEVIAAAVSASPVITGEPQKAKKPARKPSDRKLSAMIVAHQGNITAIAEELNVTRKTARSWLEPMREALGLARALNRSGRERLVNEVDIDRASERRSRDDDRDDF